MFSKKILAVAVATKLSRLAFGLAILSNVAYAERLILSPLPFNDDLIAIHTVDANGEPVFDPNGTPTFFSGELVYSSGTAIWLSMVSEVVGDCVWSALNHTYQGNAVLLPGLPIGTHTIQASCTDDMGDELNDEVTVKVVSSNESSLFNYPYSAGPRFVTVDPFSQENLVTYAAEGLPTIGYQTPSPSKWIYSKYGSSMLYDATAFPMAPMPDDLFNWVFGSMPYDASNTVLSEVHPSKDGQKMIVMTQYMQAAQNMVTFDYNNEKWIGLTPGQSKQLNVALDFQDSLTETAKWRNRAISPNAKPALGIRDSTSNIVGLGTLSVSGGTVGQSVIYRAVSPFVSSAEEDLLGIYKVVTLDASYPFFDTYRLGYNITGIETNGVSRTPGSYNYQLNAVNTAQAYDLFVKYPKASTSYAEQVTYTIETQSGLQTFVVTQTTASLGLVKLGTVRLPEGAKISVNTSSAKPIGFTEILVQKSADQSVGGSKTFVPGKSILVDFGTTTYATTTGSWNNVTDSTTTGMAIPNAVLSDGSGFSDISLAVSNRFTGSGTAGKTTNTVGFNALATRDYFYTRIGDSGEITLSNLTSGGTYTARIFASRTGTDSPYGRLSKYSSGAQSVTLNDADNTSRIAELTGLVPDANGRISIHVDVAGTSRNGHISALELKRVQ
jgi:hypothetical protein